MSELQRAAASSYTPATVQRRAKLAAAGLSAVLSLGKQRLFFFLFEISTYTLWRKITYGESGISLQTRCRWYDKQINHYLLWAFHGSGGEGRSERQNKEYAAGDKQNGSIAHIAQRIAALSRHEFGMRKETREWIFFFFSFTLMKAGLVQSAAKQCESWRGKKQP